MLELRVFQNRVMRRTFGPKMEEHAEGTGKLRNQKLYIICTLDVIVFMCLNQGG